MRTPTVIFFAIIVFLIVSIPPASFTEEKTEQNFSGDFIGNGDGTITDKSTSLMWQQEDGGKIDWHSASSYCKNLKIGSHTDWRLPTSKELSSILFVEKYTKTSDGYSLPWHKFNEAFFPKTRPSYWLSTPNSKLAVSPEGLPKAGVGYFGENFGHVKCVRKVHEKKK